MRAISVSMSPSSAVELRHLRCRSSRSAAARPARRDGRKQCARKRAWLSLITLRKSGIWQTSQSSRTAPGLVASAVTSAIARQRLQGAVVVGVAHLHEPGRRRPLVEAAQQACRPNRSAAACCARRAGSAARTGAPRPPRRSPGRAAPHRPWCRRCRRSCAGRRGRRSGRSRPAISRRGPRPSNLRQSGEGDMVEVHVEAHADRVGRDQVIDLAGLEHADLGVARARAERAEHHRRAAALAAHQLGQREHVG